MSPARENSFVEVVLDAGFVLVPDIHYETKEFVRITTARSFRDHRQTCRKFFVTSSAYDESPMTLRQIPKNRGKIYYIYPKVGGPTIDLEFPAPYLEHGKPALRAGCLSYYPKYESSLLNRELRAPESLAAAYRTLIAMLATDSERIKGKKGNYLVQTSIKGNIEEMRLGDDALILRAPLQEASVEPRDSY